MVQCAFTLALKAPRGADLSSLRGLLSQALPHQAQCGQLRWAPRRHRPGEGARGGGLAASGCGVRSAPSPQPSESLCSYREPGDAGHWVPLPEEEQLRRAWRHAASSPAGLQLRCQVSLGECQPGRGRRLRGGPGPSGARPALQCPLCRRQWAGGLSSTRWWPSTATPPRGPRTWTCSRGTPWTSCVKVGAVPALSPRGRRACGVCARCASRPWPLAVDQAWLEGHSDGRVGIFPKCFVVPAGQRVRSPDSRPPGSQDQP